LLDNAVAESFFKTLKVEHIIIIVTELLKKLSYLYLNTLNHGIMLIGSTQQLELQLRIKKK